MLGSAVSFSTIGLFTRAIAAPLPEVLVIRGISGALAIWVVARLFTKQRWTDRANFRWPALAVALLFKALIEYAESAHLRLAGWADSAYWIDTYEEGKCHHF